MRRLTVIGGGLAGSEAAWHSAQQGIGVDLFEMRPNIKTEAHHTTDLAELICSNSLRSNLRDRASGLLKEEARIMGSLLIKCAEATSIPAGSALALDRDKFSAQVTQFVSNHSCIRIIREEVTQIPESSFIIASGPLTLPKLAEAIQKETGEDNLFFFDAIAPIIFSDSLNMDFIIRASRYAKTDHDEGDYLNCSMIREEYYHFVEELRSAKKIPLKDFEKDIKSGVKAGTDHFFEGCVPIETIAERGYYSLAFGPMRPIGLKNSCTGK